VLAVLCVFLLMGILFESFALPLAVIVTIPLAAVGAWGALFVTQTPFDVTCGVGIVVLIGIVVNNGIVLIDHINQLRAQGVDRTTAIVRSGRERLRPILMTALSTIAGLVPMALGDSAVFGVPYAPMGKVVIGGLTASTLLTLIVVPSFYAWIDDARGKLLSLVRGPEASPTTEPVSPPRS
jgi:HAE1 family hydrophobic/amphiphilic exporter-1